MSRAQKRAQVNWFRGAPLKPYLPGDTYRFPSEPLLCGNALLHFLVKTYIIIADNKKGRPEGCYQHPSGPMQENTPLPHSRYNCACFSLYPLRSDLSRGRMRLCACWRCREFVKSLRRFCCLCGEAYGGRERKYHPQRLNR